MNIVRREPGWVAYLIVACVLGPAGCGRFYFENLDRAPDGGSDGSASSDAATPVDVSLNDVSLSDGGLDNAAGVDARANDGGEDGFTLLDAGSFALCNSVTSIPPIECEALVALYQSTDGPGWRDVTGWLIDPDPCLWFGVTCAAGRVVRLDLGQNRLVGTLPPELGNLGALTSVQMPINQLSGTIPGSMGAISTLQTVNLNANRLSTIDALLCDSGSLRQLYLDGNDVAAIPSEIRNCSNLQSLSLAFNRLTGAIPSALAECTLLSSLNLRSNQLTGSVPSGFSNLLDMQYLDLSENQLGGTLADLPRSNNLHTIFLHNNSFTGTVPAYLVQLSSLNGLRLNGNQLSGELPIELMSVSFVVLTLSGQAGCLTAPNASFATWVAGHDPNWNDGCP